MKKIISTLLFAGLLGCNANWLKLEEIRARPYTTDYNCVGHNLDYQKFSQEKGEKVRGVIVYLNGEDNLHYVTERHIGFLDTWIVEDATGKSAREGKPMWFYPEMNRICTFEGIPTEEQIKTRYGCHYFLEDME